MFSHHSRQEGRGGLQKIDLTTSKATATAGHKPLSCRAYSNWREKGWFWTQQDYESSGFCPTYTYNRFSDRAQQIYSFLQELDSLEGGVLRQWASRRQQVSGVAQPVLRITSFGCGPGTDAVALVSYLKEAVGASVTFHVTLIDRVSKWREIALNAVRSVLDGGDTVEFLLGTWTRSTSAAAAVSTIESWRCSCLAFLAAPVRLEVIIQ